MFDHFGAAVDKFVISINSELHQKSSIAAKFHF